MYVLNTLTLLLTLLSHDRVSHAPPVCVCLALVHLTFNTSALHEHWTSTQGLIQLFQEEDEEEPFTNLTQGQNPKTANVHVYRLTRLDILKLRAA